MRIAGHNEDGSKTKTHSRAQEGRIQWRSSSFDIVSKVDRQEADNALNQAAKELATRFDFRSTDTSIAWQGEETVTITSSTEERIKAAIDVFKEKLIRRDISMKAFDVGEPQASAARPTRSAAPSSRASAARTPRRSPRSIRDEGLKGVKAQIQGDEVRVSSKKRDDLQAVQCPAEEGRPRRRAAVRQLSLAALRCGFPVRPF